MMNVPSTATTEKKGVFFVGLQFEQIGCIFREQSVSDYGIDAQIEPILDGKASGRLIALQIKSGTSWFQEKTVTGFIFRGDLEHLDYWLNHALQVIIVLCDPDSQVACWQAVTPDTITTTGKGWKLEVPFAQKIDKASLPEFERLAGTTINLSGRYTVLSFRDVSTGVAKRYSVNLLVSENHTPRQLFLVLKEVMESLKYREYYRNEQSKNQWEGKPAQVIFLFVYRTLEDFRTTNWIYRSLWVDPNLPDKFAPLKFKGEDIGDGVAVEWSSHYKAMRQFITQHSLTKEAFLTKIQRILVPVLAAADNAIALTVHHELGELEPETYLQHMQALESVLQELFLQVTDIGIAPFECMDLYSRFKSLVSFAHNIVLPYSPHGMQTWQMNNRRYITRRAIEDYQKDAVRLQFELEKVQ